MAEIVDVEPRAPRYQVDQLRERNADYCVLVFVINEGERVRTQLSKMAELTDQVDIVIADGGSQDGSLGLDFLREVGVTALLTKLGGGKLSAQMRMGFEYGLRQGYRGFVVIDGNNKDDVSAIPLFVDALKAGVDHIQGSRFIPGGNAINTPKSRLIGLKVLHAPLISLAARQRYTDTTNGFRAYSDRLIRDPKVSVFRPVFESYELHYHLAIEAGRRPDFTVTEVPVTRAYPEKGKTPTKISPVKGNVKILSILFSAVRGKYRITNAEEGASQ